MPLISRKKTIYPVSPTLRQYLRHQKKEVQVAVSYQDLLRYTSTISLYDAHEKDTLWETLFYAPQEMQEIYTALKKIYALLKAEGELSVIEHLYVDRVDLCTYGNTQPIRVRIVNRINDNFDYFYVKQADASRIYGLELEDLTSPNRVQHFVSGQTLIEEHIAGVPGEQFMRRYLNKNLNRTRLAKEFVKFNERCFVRLLGDMHASNYVVDITPDFEETHYRIRAIDFDQQSYEGQKKVYMPKYFKENNPIIKIGLELMTPETTRQYQIEERSMIAHRLRSSYNTVDQLIQTMRQDQIAPPENTYQLKHELADYYGLSDFLTCQSMGDLLRMSLKQVFNH
ncbi:MAG: hypothetical protein ACFCUI_12565 [Bernardetiaceae bacterium]